jgi:hypothetical protein
VDEIVAVNWLESNRNLIGGVSETVPQASTGFHNQTENKVFWGLCQATARVTQRNRVGRMRKTGRGAIAAGLR